MGACLTLPRRLVLASLMHPRSICRRECLSKACPLLPTTLAILLSALASREVSLICFTRVSMKATRPLLTPNSRSLNLQMTSYASSGIAGSFTACACEGSTQFAGFQSPLTRHSPSAHPYCMVNKCGWESVPSKVCSESSRLLFAPQKSCLLQLLHWLLRPSVKISDA